MPHPPRGLVSRKCLFLRPAAFTLLTLSLAPAAHAGEPRGWPVRLDQGVVMSSPAVGDLNGDGQLEVVVAAGTSVYVVEHGGVMMEGWPKTLSETPPPPKPEPVRRPAKVARMLALAHHLQSAIDRGLVADRAAVARKLGLTRARVTQLLDLLLLAPDLQQAVLGLEAVDGAEPMSERALRAVAHAGSWVEHRGAWATSAR